MFVALYIVIGCWLLSLMQCVDADYVCSLDMVILKKYRDHFFLDTFACISVIIPFHHAFCVLTKDDHGQLKELMRGILHYLLTDYIFSLSPFFEINELMRFMHISFFHILFLPFPFQLTLHKYVAAWYMLNFLFIRAASIYKPDPEGLLVTKHYRLTKFKAYCGALLISKVKL